MPRKSYPLEVLLDLRNRRVEDATVELASAIRARESAEEQRQALEITRARAAAEASVARAAERDALAQGVLRAADLQRGGAWERVARAEREAMDAKVEHAALAEQSAADDEARARGELVQRKADADVVDKDRSRYLERARKRIVAMEEECASDAWRKR
ncbi:hypothetical protein LVJ94_42515 [Pendulispora rubella]|uniref:Uncharacterized protein n=1 Tax=Pendulispora rubella TaxID=2741070 RepID=A0ABZ2L2T5_9BACT